MARRAEGGRAAEGVGCRAVVTRRARFSPPVERSDLRGARHASTARGDRISVGRPRSARRRVPDLEFGRGKWFASRGDYSVKYDVDPSGESDAAVWHLSHGIPREFWRWELWRWSAFFRERCGGACGDIHNDARARTNARRTDANASTDEQREPATRSGLDEERPPVANPRLHSRSG